MTTVAGLTLGELFDDPALHLELVVGDVASRDRRVLGAHSIEIPHPVRWLDPEWIMLTTGISFTTERQQRDLIRELDAGGVSALGVGFGPVFQDALPRAMRTTAERLDFPLFAIPKGAPFRGVIGAVQQRALSGEIRSFGRLAAMERFLMDALRRPEADACIVERLETLLDAEVGVVNSDGTLSEGRCRLSALELASFLGESRGPEVRIETEKMAGWGMRIGKENRPAANWLVVGVKRNRVEHPLLKPAAKMALPLLEACGHLRDARRAEERAAKRATLDDLTTSTTRSDSEVAAARAASWGVDPNERVRILIARRVDEHDLIPVDEEELASHIEGTGVPTLITTQGSDTIMLLRDGRDLKLVQHALLDSDPDLRLGVGRAVQDGGMVSVSHADAGLVLRWNRDPDRRTAFYEDLDLAAVLIAEVPAERIEAKIQDWVQKLQLNPVGFETLRTYFENELDIARTSRVLHLHPNSTRYRLNRVEEVLGMRLRQPETITTLHLMFLAHDYIGGVSVADVRVRAVASDGTP